MSTKHSYLTIGLLTVGAILVVAGSLGGGVLFLLWPLACLGMLVWMMRGMHRGSDHPHDDDGGTHSQDDAPTHSHR